ncbi:diaminopimelate epimerase [Rhodocytophaga rosea]|uniref:Diaminopimelate epimerase n=1 Tax=Rhodocytophaga rosea TaxID=2704465 RepID=A0A6C0GNG6_9BACT|nr:diaminopimelate epimerase [Rhodocytophaga rosea]QHT69477.1 diaminopimelate epimerase [Rhodocytophaga rosea]
MLIHFYKYQGTGNDFVMIDDRSETFPQDTTLVAKLCHRRFGIGADGLILLQNHPEYDFRMVYFNADGKKGSMCGNGGRCTVQFAKDLGVIADSTTFEAADGRHEAHVKDGLIHLKMGDVHQVKHMPAYDFLNTGSPHYVAFVDKLSELDVVGKGKAIRYDSVFAPGGTNVNFVEQLSDNTLFVRTYERGVEDETYSCGTGVTACALAASARHLQSPVNIKTLGGNLQVAFQSSSPEQFTNIYLIGPAQKVYEGTIEVGEQSFISGH